MFIAVLQVDAAGVRVAYRKSWLDEAEAERFSAGPGPTVLDVDGWRLGLGVCKDTGAMRHVAGMAALGVDGYLAGLVHRPAETRRAVQRAPVGCRGTSGEQTSGDGTKEPVYSGDSVERPCRLS